MPCHPTCITTSSLRSPERSICSRDANNLLDSFTYCELRSGCTGGFGPPVASGVVKWQRSWSRLPRWWSGRRSGFSPLASFAERPRPFSVRLTCHGGGTCTDRGWRTTDRGRRTPNNARRKQGIRQKGQLRDALHFFGQSLHFLENALIALVNWLPWDREHLASDLCRFEIL